MKNLFYFFCSVAVCIMGLTYCNGDPDPDPGPDPDPDPTPKEFTALVSGAFIGNKNDKGIFDLVVDVESKDNNGRQFEIFLTLLSDMIADDDILDAALAAQKFVISSSEDIYTIKHDGYIMENNTKIALGEGAIDVSLSGGNYTMKFNITDGNDDTYEFEYVGMIDFEPQYEALYDTQNGWYWGDNTWDYPGIGQYMSTFYVGELVDYEIYDGHYIALSFYDEMAPKAWEAQIPNKTYVASEGYEVGTFRIATEEIREKDRWRMAAYAYYASGTDGDVTKQFITGGKIKVLAKGEDQEVRFNILVEDGTRHVGKYTGYVRQGDEYTVTTLRDDVEIGQLDFGYLDYEGPSPMAGKDNNRWNIRLYNSGLTVDPSYYWGVGGVGEFVRIGIYTDHSSTTDIPVGEYPIGDEIIGNAGIGEGMVGLDWGTWYFNLHEDTEDAAPAKTGTITVSKTGDTYTVNIDVVDDRENHITGNYTGPLEFYDSSY